jgi:hypothetical protein
MLCVPCCLLSATMPGAAYQRSCGRCPGRELLHRPRRLAPIRLAITFFNFRQKATSDEGGPSCQIRPVPMMLRQIRRLWARWNNYRFDFGCHSRASF